MMHCKARTLCCAALLALLSAISAHAGDAPPVRAADLPPIQVDQEELQPAYRFDYAASSRDHYAGLMATRDIYALLYEHDEAAASSTTGAYHMDRLAFLFGGPSRPQSHGDVEGGNVYVGLGETQVRGAQQASAVSLLLQVRVYFIANDFDAGPEFKFAVPLSELGTSFTRETDAEFAWRYGWKHGTLRFGYRVLAVNTTSRPGAWFVGVGVYY